MRNLCNISSYKQVSEKGIICEDKQVCIKLKIQKKKKKKKQILVNLYHQMSCQENLQFFEILFLYSSEHILFSMELHSMELHSKPS